MKALALILAMALTAGAVELRWKFSHETNRLTFSFNCQSNHVYSIARKDLVSNYYDTVFFLECRTNGVIEVEIDPLATGEDLNPKPSGQFVFYLVDGQW